MNDREIRSSLCDYNHETLAATSILKRCPGCDAPLQKKVDEHFLPMDGSKTLTPNVAPCKDCGLDACNCKTCYAAKGNNFNLCTKCYRKRKAVENAS